MSKESCVLLGMLPMPFLLWLTFLVYQNYVKKRFVPLVNFSLSLSPHSGFIFSVTIMVRKRKEGLQSSAFFVFLACMEKKSTAHDCHSLDDHACCCFYYVKRRKDTKIVSRHPFLQKERYYV